jgi:beta-lactamase class D
MRILPKQLAILGIFVLTIFGPINSSFAEQKEMPELAEFFLQQNAVGTFALYDPAYDRLILVNAVRAAERMFPASTFKIANSLVALETKVVDDENEIIPYGGKPQIFKIWEHDMSLRDGIKISNVPIFQELAGRIGFAGYEKWLELLNYGNGQVGQNIETFWLRGPLKISAIEQVRFLSNLA